MTADTKLKLSEREAAELLSGVEGIRVSIPVMLIRRVGNDIVTAAFIQQAAFLTGISLKTRPDGAGWFDLPQTGEPKVEIKDEEKSIFARLGSWEWTLGIGPDAQLAARRKLSKLGLLEEKRKGVPARTHYRVLPSVYLAFLASGTTSFGNSGNKIPEFPKQDSGIPEASHGETTEQDSGYPETIPERFSIGFDTTTPTTPSGDDEEGGGMEVAVDPAQEDGHDPGSVDQGRSAFPKSGTNTTPSIDELVDSAIWAKEMTEPIRNPSGYRARVRRRLKVQITEDDMETWRSWRATKNYRPGGEGGASTSSEAETKKFLRELASRGRSTAQPGRASAALREATAGGGARAVG
jgi:hypothetical protein